MRRRRWKTDSVVFQHNCWASSLSVACMKQNPKTTRVFCRAQNSFGVGLQRREKGCSLYLPIWMSFCRHSSWCLSCSYPRTPVPPSLRLSVMVERAASTESICQVSPCWALGKRLVTPSQEQSCMQGRGYKNLSTKLLKKQKLVFFMHFWALPKC